MKRFRYIILGLSALIIFGIIWAPVPHLELDYSKVVYDNSGQLLSAKIAKDEQWRLPLEEDLPKELETAILHFEDEYFYYHPGFNPISILKAFYTNLKAGKIKRGASTITMQVMRMYYAHKKRGYSQKVIELLGALKLELLYSKKEILTMWARVAPFGGNTVGASTASWRYFSRSLSHLSWAEYSTLAVLPNTPSKIHMDKNVSFLTKKRNALLKKLYIKGIIDELEYELALSEEIIFEQKDLPQESIHFMEFLSEKYPNQNQFHSTIDRGLQKTLSETLEEYSTVYQLDGIENASGIIVDTEMNTVVAYVGNTHYGGKTRFVDCVQAPRSYGSLLKPFLYTYAVDKGYFMPKELVKDIPTNINGFVPKNFDRKFRGAVPLDQMVSLSLNVPAVRVLNYVGLSSFHGLLVESLKLDHINKSPDHHGLSIILGGAECTMWEITKLYKGLVRNQNGLPFPYGPLQCLMNEIPKENDFEFSPTSIWHTFQAMMSVNRPEEEQNYVKMGGQNIAWKTGTSYGHRDAWAVGTNGKYVVAIWVGNETGEGVYNLTGAKKAGPILFKVLRYLNGSGGLEENIIDSEEVITCEQSGKVKGRLCNSTTTTYLNQFSHNLRQCDHHQVVKKNEEKGNNDTLFVLSPLENFYANQTLGHSFSIPQHKELILAESESLNIVYPEDDAVLFIPKKIEQDYSKVVLKANSSLDGDILFWFINGDFVQKTSDPHLVNLDLDEGDYSLYVNNKSGVKDELVFHVVKR